MGRLTGGKGLEFAFAFMKRLRAAGGQFRLVIAGGASEAEMARYRQKAEACSPDIFFLGQQDPVYPLYRMFDALFFPSESWTEALPGAVLEAAMHGLPVLSRDNPEVREIAAVYPAIYFMADDEEPVYALERLFALPPADTSVVAERFGIAAMARRTLALYDALLTERGVCRSL